MKTIIKITTLSMFAMALVSSCTSKYYTSRSVPIEKHDIPSEPLVADLEVDMSKTINGEAILVGKFYSIEDAKQVALWEAQGENDADVIVDPIFILTISGKAKKAEVTGYKGTYKDVRKATNNDLELLSIYRKSIGGIVEDKQTGVGKFFKK